MTQNKLYLYHPNYQRADVPDDLPFYFFGSSSRGNSVYLPKLSTIIDLGMTFKEYDKYDQYLFTKVRYILLTHKHSDHLNLSTLHKILKLYPHVHFIVSPYVTKFLGTTDLNWDITEYRDRFYQLKITNTDYKIPTYQDLTLKLPDGFSFNLRAISTHHDDVINTAYYLHWKDVEALNARSKSNAAIEVDQYLVYASDFNHIEDLKPIDAPLNYCLLEANYDPQLVSQELMTNGEKRFEAQGNLRHLSEPDAWKYVEKHVAKDGYFLPLHASKNFGTLNQDLTDQD